jgi:predicted RNase H-like HicB family nuclease
MQKQRFAIDASKPCCFVQAICCAQMKLGLDWNKAEQGASVNYRIEFEQEEDGRWIADIPELPGVMAYGSSKREAESKVQAIALRVIADTLERDQATTDHVKFAAA